MQLFWCSLCQVIKIVLILILLFSFILFVCFFWPERDLAAVAQAARPAAQHHELEVAEHRTDADVHRHLHCTLQRHQGRYNIRSALFISIISSFLSAYHCMCTFSRTFSLAPRIYIIVLTDLLSSLSFSMQGSIEQCSRALENSNESSNKSPIAGPGGRRGKLIRLFVPKPIGDELDNATGLNYFA